MKNQQLSADIIRRELEFLMKRYSIDARVVIDNERKRINAMEVYIMGKHKTNVFCIREEFLLRSLDDVSDQILIPNLNVFMDRDIVFLYRECT